jgi:hypothetical protein
LLGSLGLRQGGRVYAHFVGSALPISQLDSLPTLLRAAEGKLSLVAEVGGTVDAMTLDASARLSPLRIGRATLPASNFELRLVPTVREQKVIGTTRCGKPIGGPFERAEYDADAASGVFHARGDLFGGQIRFDDLTVTRQVACLLGQHRPTGRCIQSVGRAELLEELGAAVDEHRVGTCPRQEQLDGRDVAEHRGRQSGHERVEVEQVEPIALGRVERREHGCPLLREPRVEQGRDRLDRFGARAVVIRKDYTVFETTGHREETEKLVQVLEPYGLIEFVRSARVAIIKASSGFHEKLKEFEESEPGAEVKENEFLGKQDEVFSM